MTESQKKWTLLPLLQWSAEYLQQKGFTGSRLLAERLLAHVLQLSRVELYLRYDRPLSPDELAAFKGLFKRILAHEPLQYVLGETEFMSLVFAVGPGVLIPRPETELLVESALQAGRALAERQSVVDIIDVGTGSGCIAISLANYLEAAQVTAVDVSEAALQWARQNMEKHQLQERIEVLAADLLADPPAAWKNRFDMMVSNPPYVRDAEYPELAPEIRDYEPRQALCAGEKGLLYYERLAVWARQILKESGQFFIEIGDGMAEPVSFLFRKHGFHEIDMKRDLAGRERLIHTITRGEHYE